MKKTVFILLIVLLLCSCNNSADNSQTIKSSDVKTSEGTTYYDWLMDEYLYTPSASEIQGYDDYEVPFGFIKLHKTDNTIIIVNTDAIAMIIPQGQGSFASVYVSFGVGQGNGYGRDTTYAKFETRESYQEIVDAINKIKANN